MGSLMQVAPWEMMEEDEGETAAGQQQPHGGPLQPVPFLNISASMAGHPNATVTDNTQLPASLHSQVGHTIEAAKPLSCCYLNLLSTADAANHS